MTRVLVTGGSGFIGGHAVLRLLEAGHEVRTTVRSAGSEERARAALRVGGAEADGRVSFFHADLAADDGWGEAVEGCDFVLHVASPFPSTLPDHEDDLIVPARDGALRVLRAARDAGVRRVVMTSSFAAIGYGHEQRSEPFDETVWTDVDAGDVTPYAKSKTVAERAAWDFIRREGGGLELAVVNPVAVFGPVLGPDYSTSVTLIHRLLAGDLPGCPKLFFGVVDVRDVVELHLRAMTDPAAAGERFLAISGATMSIKEMADALRARMGDAAKDVPTRELPNWLVRLFALFDPQARAFASALGKKKEATNRKARDLLGWDPIPPEDAIVATGESILRLGLLEE